MTSSGQNSSDPSDATGPVREAAGPLRGRGWLNTGGVDLDLEDLRGKIVVLDFWTFCCVNCLHVLDELRPLEQKWSDEVVVVGVHSPKFEFEKDPDALAANIERYEVTHPVLDDPELQTWTEYGARAWPTLMVLDTQGRIAANLSGEGHASTIDDLVGRLVGEGEADGSLRRGPAPTVLSHRTPQPLRYPSKITDLPDGRLLVSDTGQHRLVILDADGFTVDEVIGAGRRGSGDGDGETATFAEPNGVLELPPEVAEEVGYDLLVADSANHLLRSVGLGAHRLLRGRAPSTVGTVAGTGSQWMQGDVVPGSQDPVAEDRPVYDPLAQPLSTPWDLTWSHRLGRVVIAMAGIHQIWTFDPRTGALGVLAGTTQEGLVDGPLAETWWAQPSGIVELADGNLAVADSESSAIRVIDLARGEAHTLVGTGLFDFGHVDGPAAHARLQHPLGLVPLPDGRIAVADTYNGAIRLLEPHGEQGPTLVTVATELAEPSAAIVGAPIDGIGQLIVVESGGHRLTWVPIAKAAERVLDEGAQHTARPVTEIGEGELDLRVLFTPPPGHKLDDSLGPSTQVTVQATPPTLLRSGAGTSTDLSRVLDLDPEQSEGVLHVSARAASCDAAPDVEFPACHMHQQDWGVPIRIVTGGPHRLDLSLLD
jgi:thiol-disulfide isomerase/thioredoxin